MTSEQKAAYIIAQAAAASAVIAGMQAENAYREARGEAQAYPQHEFENVIHQYGIHHNAIIGFFNS